MATLQVKKYNQTIAFSKWYKALERWKERGYGYPAKTMFFFTLDNGENRKKGYITFDESKAVFGMTKEESSLLFNDKNERN